MDGGAAPTSSTSSVNMFRRLAGIATSGATEKLRPTEFPGVGYGSWPTIRTLTFSSG